MQESSQGVETTRQLGKPHSRFHQLEPQPMRVTERVRVNDGDVLPGWIRATAILLRGMERLRLQELTDADDAH